MTLSRISAIAFLLVGAAWAAPKTPYIEIILNPPSSERIGDGFSQLIFQQADGKISGESEIRKLHKVLELAGWKEADVEKLVASAKFEAPEVKKTLAALKGKTGTLVDWFLSEVKNSAVAKDVGVEAPK
ncbi:MAG: hypothetical protein J0L75_08570 [Spirochaetes bacterium]|nr:hypothetical protein [Spirochaetota bacterium]